MEVPDARFGFKEPATTRNPQIALPSPPGDAFRPAEATGLDPARDLVPRVPGLAAEHGAPTAGGTALIAAVARVQPGTGTREPLSSMEFKMLLQPSRFADAARGVRAFGRIVEEVVNEDPQASMLHGAHLAKGGMAFAAGARLAGHAGDAGAGPSTRYVAYLDTPDFALNRLGYIARERSSKPIAGAASTGANELMLKFRSPDRDLAASKEVYAAPEFEAKAKFEMDATVQDGAIRRLYSKSAKTEVPGMPADSVGALAAVFPPVAEIGLPTTTPLSLVNGRRIREDSYPAGTIPLAKGVDAKAGVSVWYPQQEAGAHPVIAEFSFALKIDPDADPGSVQSARAAAERLLVALRREAADWASGGGTKTEYIYGPGQGPPGD